jgi:hypothetical protein
MLDLVPTTSTTRRATGVWLARPKQLRLLLVEREWRHAEAAERVQISTGVFGRVACGSMAAWPALRARMCEVFGVTEDELFEQVA